ncbi:hypothetical protein P873_08040 [Arenimonas composti TR7-09 = DSM 18010]|uniref:Stress-induced protein n=1 Tax=Arenimonas composti TR7-09 = DSM 18010 TaxID=1121013 RepID=A0A091BHB3_9GAMM|nr:hypothetical protein P873_08040 [Arenimonas composti TR7-09 = DSM 18010]
MANRNQQGGRGQQSQSQGSQRGSRSSQGQQSQSQGGGNRGSQGQQNQSEGRGFAGMDPERQREIASEGGKAAHRSGNAHEFDSQEAREAGRKGGEASGGGNRGGR